MQIERILGRVIMVAPFSTGDYEPTTVRPH